MPEGTYLDIGRKHNVQSRKTDYIVKIKLREAIRSFNIALDRGAVGL